AALGTLSTRAQENLTGVRVVRAYAQEKPEIAQFDEANREYVDRNIQLISSWSLFFPALTALIGVSFVILLGKGGVQVMDGRVSLGTLWSFYTFLIQLVFPIIPLGWVTNIFQRGAASMGRLNYIMQAEPNLRDVAASDKRNGAKANSSAENGRSGDIRGEIELKHLTFAYPTGSAGNAGPTVLDDINLHIPAG